MRNALAVSKPMSINNFTIDCQNNYQNRITTSTKIITNIALHLGTKMEMAVVPI